MVGVVVVVLVVGVEVVGCYVVVDWFLLFV